MYHPSTKMAEDEPPLQH